MENMVKKHPKISRWLRPNSDCCFVVVEGKTPTVLTAHLLHPAVVWGGGSLRVRVASRLRVN